MHILSMDIGGTNIKSGIFLDNNLFDSFVTETNASSGFINILNSIDEVYQHYFLIYKDIEIITISTAGDIDYINGICRYASDNLKGFTGFKIKEYIEREYKVKCYVNNDAVCHLLGILNDNNINKDIFMITLGTGVGAVLYKNKEIYYGENFNLGRFAHYTINKFGMKCDCGKRGCAEKELSICYLKKEIQNKYHYEMSVKNLFDLYLEKDKKAISILKKYFRKLNKFLEFVDSLGVDIIYISGGIANSTLIFKEFIKNKKVEYVKDNDLLGVYGAIKLIK
ncbi:MAG: ROK family protein [Firmicutes bacterium]|uniref:ROK family protein n=1 Tax=Candidatus Onthovivens merdipullorum TaxID=2840889 RepID=A0A9D9DI33_9BACL|nr:ROK family protein [Candidatus Onthovivens merdipullorum]